MEEVPFDVDALHALIDAALTATDDRQRPAQNPERGRSDHGSLPLSLLNTKILTVMAELVGKYLPPADMMQLFDELRHELYAGLDHGNVRQLYTQVQHCTRCPNLEHPARPSRGNQHDPMLMVVTTHSSVYEQDQLAQHLPAAGFHPDQILYTSLIRCATTHPRTPEPDELANCHGYLLAEIQLVKPKLILLCGAAPLQALVGEGLAITKTRGTMFCLGPWFFLPTHAVGYIPRRASAEEELVTDLRTAYRICTGGEV